MIKGLESQQKIIDTLHISQKLDKILQKKTRV